jgi:CHASE2 domain-containing sensor protein
MFGLPDSLFTLISAARKHGYDRFTINPCTCYLQMATCASCCCLLCLLLLLLLQGYPPLQSWARDIVCELHQPATLRSNSSGSNVTSTVQQQQQQAIGLDVAITPGASAALDALVRVLLNPGDAMLLEEFTYNHHAEAHLLPMG